MEETDAYSHRDWVRAVNLSGVLGWLFVSAPITWGISNGSLLNFLGLMVWAAAIGLPIAFGASWLVSAPILKRVMHNKITWARAAVWGGAITFLIALFSTVIGRLYGLMQSMNPNSSSQLGGGDKIREVDGILTAYGWLMLGQRTAVFVAAGVLIALLVRAVIGPGRSI
ncbi:hypothetical protein [Lentibacter sp.]|uniref:hypothetical protein n=1 Tax=Lentibacter sp. TaxID=2024994 RepID=UPI003F6A5B4F